MADFDDEETRLAIEASLGIDISQDLLRLEQQKTLPLDIPAGPSSVFSGLETASRPRTSAVACPDTSSTADATHRAMSSMEEQLAERRARLSKRKLEQENMLQEYGSAAKRSPSAAPAPFAPTGTAGSQDGQMQPADVSQDELDMLLDGLEMDDTIRQAIARDPVMRNDLIRQLQEHELAQIQREHRGARSDSSTPIPGVPADDDDEAGWMQDQAGALPDGFELMSLHASRPALGFSFPDGALRMTRTFGRASTPNCISVDQLVDKNTLTAACLYAFAIGNSEFLPFFPIDKGSKVPIYVGRDVNLDPMAAHAMKAHGMTRGKKTSYKQLEIIRSTLKQMYGQMYGPHYEAFHPKCQGCAHSKFMILIYPTFCRLVITSCNFINLDMVHGDNHWYIHDLPRFSSNKALKVNTKFEKLLTVHLRELGCPKSFLERHFSGRFDFSAVRVQLVTSRPGAASGPLAESSGLLRLRRTVLEMDGIRSEILKHGLRLECCTGSVGWLNEQWLREFCDVASGKTRLEKVSRDCKVPDVRVVFPTYEDVDGCDELARKFAGSEIGAYLNWGNAPPEIKATFHHYYSKDPGKLFHMKLLVALNPDADDRNDESVLPYYMYIGSHNFSKGAWGRLKKVDKMPAGQEKYHERTRGMKVDEGVNYECGVVIPRLVIPDLLETGTTWQDIIPYERPLVPYEDESRPFKNGKRDEEK